MPKRNIYVAGYPKSGNVYLTRLLGTVLDSPTAAYWDKESRKDMASEGLERPGSYIIRRGHFILVNDGLLEPVPDHHRLNWPAIGEDMAVFIIRDPRDIAVSARHYWNNSRKHGYSIADILHHMRNGTRMFRLMGSWTSYVRSWITTSEDFLCSIVKYEELVKHPVRSVQALAEELSIELPSEREIKAACDKESFASRRKYIEEHGQEVNLGKKWNLMHMRKGVSGDWVNHFSPSDRKLAAAFFNPLMLELGYVNKGTWWRK